MTWTRIGEMVTFWTYFEGRAISISRQIGHGIWEKHKDNAKILT